MSGNEILEDKTMAKTSPIEFFKQVRSEARKVTWPTRQETTVSVIAVFIMVFLASVFLYFADQLIAMIVRGIMSFGL
jgi:preprotein translocase subunit SecE